MHWAQHGSHITARCIATQAAPVPPVPLACTVCFMMGSVTSCALPAGTARAGSSSGGGPHGALRRPRLEARARCRGSAPAWPGRTAFPTRFHGKRPPRVNAHVALPLNRLPYCILGSAREVLSHRLHRCAHGPQHACAGRGRGPLPIRGLWRQRGRAALQTFRAPLMP